MKTISVKAVKRDEYGKKAAKAVRREGMVPCVLSGHGESVSFSVDPREIKPLIYTPNSYIVEFDFDGKKSRPCCVRLSSTPSASRSCTSTSTVSPRATRFDRHSGTPDG